MRTTERKLSLVGALLGALLFATALNAAEERVAPICGNGLYKSHDIDFHRDYGRVHGFRCWNDTFDTRTDEQLPPDMVAPLLEAESLLNEEE